MSPLASELPLSLPIEDVYILMPWTREVGPVLTTELAQIIMEIRMFVGLAKTYNGWLKQRNLVMKATLSPLVHGSATEGYCPSTLLGRVAQICHKYFSPGVDLLEQYRYELVRQLMLHTTDLRPARFFHLDELDRWLAKLAADNGSHPVLICQVPWGKEGGIYQKAHKRFAVTKIVLTPLCNRWAPEA